MLTYKNIPAERHLLELLLHVWTNNPFLNLLCSVYFFCINLSFLLKQLPIISSYSILLKKIFSLSPRLEFRLVWQIICDLKINFLHFCTLVFWQMKNKLFRQCFKSSIRAEWGCHSSDINARAAKNLPKNVSTNEKKANLQLCGRTQVASLNYKASKKDEVDGFTRPWWVNAPLEDRRLITRTFFSHL